MSQPTIPLAKPWFDGAEPSAAADVVKSEWLFMGPRVREFEERFAREVGCRHAIALNSGSSALLVSLMALGIQPGDELLVPDMTFVSTASCALFVGAVPRMVDIELQTYGMDPADLTTRITEKTRAILPVHYAGQAAAMGAILAVAERHSIPVIEDAAEAQTSRVNGRHVGTLGVMGIFSFTPSKAMTVGEGGMLVTDRDDLAERARVIRNFGDTSKFQWDILGYNFRMMDIQAAIGLCQLDKVHEAIQRRWKIAARFDAALSRLPGVITPAVPITECMNYQLYTIRLDRSQTIVTRDQLCERLAARGIASRVYFPPLHRAPIFAHLRPGTDAEFPNAALFGDTALSLPMYPTMTDDEVARVTGAVTACLDESL